MFGLETCCCCYVFVLDKHNGTPTSIEFLGATIEINNETYHEQKDISTFHFLGEGEAAGLKHLLIILCILSYV